MRKIISLLFKNLLPCRGFVVEVFLSDMLTMLYVICCMFYDVLIKDKRVLLDKNNDNSQNVTLFFMCVCVGKTKRKTKRKSLLFSIMRVFFMLWEKLCISY